MISLFLANGGGNFFRVSSRRFLLVVFLPKLPRNFSKIDLVQAAKSQKWVQPPLMLLENTLCGVF